MKLNTKLGICKQQVPLEVVLLEDVRRLDALEAKVASLSDALTKTKAPEPQEEQKALEPVLPPKPSSFTLDIRRREDGFIKEVKALDAETGLLYYTFDVRRDQFGAVKNIAAIPKGE